MKYTRLNRNIQKLAEHFERGNISEYIQLMQSPLKIIFLNFIGGLARGFGIAVGMTIIVALLAYILARLINLPIIGFYIAQIVEIVNKYLAQSGTQISR